jgi:hypothetical protein
VRAGGDRITDAPDENPAPDVALRLRCSACGSRDIRGAMNMAEYYATLRASTDWQRLCRL